jgi:hypothetical protein
MRRIISHNIVFSCRKAKRLGAGRVLAAIDLFNQKLTKKEKAAIFFINTTLNLN